MSTSLSTFGIDNRHRHMQTPRLWFRFSAGRDRYHWITNREISTVATLINYCAHPAGAREMRGVSASSVGSPDRGLVPYERPQVGPTFGPIL
jgi:hypothetical protein